MQLLRQLLRRSEFFRPFITVNIIDGFQGQKRDIIVSLVRSNEAGQIGFLRDLRRMNVAFSQVQV